MSSGGHSLAEAWNLQLQGRVRDLETDLAEALRHLTAVTGSMRDCAKWTLADGFVKRMAEKERVQRAQARDIDAFITEGDVSP